MLLDTLIAGVQAVCSVTSLLREENARRHDAELGDTLKRIESQLDNLSRQIAGLATSAEVPARTMRTYGTLLRIMRGNPHYSRHLILRRSTAGTWTISRRKKKGILRDPRGEYARLTQTDYPQDSTAKTVEIDENGNVHEIGKGAPLRNPFLPEYPVACRCKDQVEIREVITLTLVKELLETRSIRHQEAPLRWLDLCCGRGSILQHFRPTLSYLCKQLEYYGVDVEPAHIRECEKIAKKKRLHCLLADIGFEHHDISKPLSPQLPKFDFVTLINVLHELDPLCLFDVLASAVRHCSPSGRIVIVDMAELPHLEWKAISWHQTHLERLVAPLFRLDHPVSATPHTAHVANFQRSVEVLAITIRKRSIDMAVFSADHGKAKDRFQRNVRMILRKMARDTSDQLVEAFDASGDPVGHSAKLPDVLHLLWRHWAISEALKAKA